MSTFRNPVGPQSKRVYWRRRLVVLLGLLAVIAIVILIVARPGSGNPAAPSGANTKSPNSSVSPSATGTPADLSQAKACDPAKVTVIAATDANSFGAAANPVLSFALKSTDTVPCTFTAGSDVQEFSIKSGTELYWDSKDCQTGKVAATVLLKPFIPFAGSTLTWDRTRSSASGCATPGAAAPAGGASYHLVIKVNGIVSNDVQFLLN